jgi:hypothetical protein
VAPAAQLQHLDAHGIRILDLQPILQAATRLEALKMAYGIEDEADAALLATTLQQLTGLRHL